MIYMAIGFRDHGSEGNYLVKAESVWFFYDTEKMIPVRVMPEDVAAYGEESAADLGKLQERSLFQKNMKREHSVTIAAHHLDTNHHVTMQYVDIAREAVPMYEKW